MPSSPTLTGVPGLMVVGGDRLDFWSRVADAVEVHQRPAVAYCGPATGLQSLEEIDSLSDDRIFVEVF